MPRSADMNWVRSGRKEENRPRLWKKVYRGKVYTISCRQLRDQGFTVFADSKDGSYQAANEWWRKKRAEIDAIDQRPACKPEPLDDVVLARAGVLAIEKAYPGFLDQVPCEQKRFLVERIRSIVFDEMITEGKLPPSAEQYLPPARLHELQDGLKALRGEPAADREKTVQAHADLWLKKQQALVAASQMTASRCANNRTCLENFKTFLGPQSAVNAIDSQRLEGFYLYCMEKIRREGRSEGWSVAYAKDVFSVSRSFVRWAWEQGVCELPRNIDVKVRFGSAVKAVKTWTAEEFKKVVDAAPGKLKLALLLMANTGATQKDVSDLLDSEVDWTGGRIIRRRSKTAAFENAPVVNYKLWPLTFELLQKYRSGQDRVLLTEGGQPFVRTSLRTDGKQVKADGFASNFVHVKKRLKLQRSLKQLRKLGASLLGTHKDYGRFTSYFLGHSPRTVADRHYVQPSQVLFDEAVLWLGEQLGQVEKGEG